MTDLIDLTESYLDACGGRDPLECWFAAALGVAAADDSTLPIVDAIFEQVAPEDREDLCELVKARYLRRLRLHGCDRRSASGTRHLGVWGLLEHTIVAGGR